MQRTAGLTDVRWLSADEAVAMVGTLGQYRCKTLRVDCPDRVVAAVNAQQIRQELEQRYQSLDSES